MHRKVINTVFLSITLVYIFSTTAVCLAMELPSNKYPMETERRSVIIDSQKEQLQQISQQPGESSEVIYSIEIFNITPEVKPGGIVELEVFFSGFGIPTVKKLHVNWSSPYIIDRENPGFIEVWTTIGTIQSTGESGATKRQAPLIQHIDPDGCTITVGESCFLPPIKSVDGQAMLSTEQVGGEITWSHKQAEDGPEEAKPPILLTIYTDKSAQPGDYQVIFTFTYGNENELHQDYKTVSFHITSCWERIQVWVIGITVFIAFASLVVTAVWYATHWK